MRAVIIGNGDICNYEYIKSRLLPEDFFICADGGLKHTKLLGIAPKIALGDFDSSNPSDDINTMKFPVDKDMTDSELAILYAIENGFDEILLLAMSGRRLDHTLTNILMLFKCDNISMLDDNNEIYPLRKHIKIMGKKGKTMSIIPVFSDLQGVSTIGVKYPLFDETLYFSKSRGNSNIIIDDTCEISVREGMGIVIINDGE